MEKHSAKLISVFYLLFDKDFLISPKIWHSAKCHLTMKVSVILLRDYEKDKVVSVLMVEPNILKENTWNKKLNISNGGNRSA